MKEVRWEVNERLNVVYNSVLDARAGELEARAEKVEEFVLTESAGTRVRFPLALPEPESENGPGSSAALHELSKKLWALRESISGIDSGLQDSRFERIVYSPPERDGTFAPRSVTRRQINANIPARLNSRGCPVCDYVGEVVFDFLTRTQYTLYCDERAQNGFATAGGLCPLHLWQLHSVSSPLGEAAGLAPLVERISQLLAQVRNPSEAQAAVKALLLDSKSCPACVHLQETERDFIERLASSLDEADDLAAYGRSRGVCLRHLDLLIRVVSRAEIVQFLIGSAAQRFQETAEDMYSYATKRAVARRDLTNTDEEYAALSAINHLVGSRNLCMPLSEKEEI